MGRKAKYKPAAGKTSTAQKEAVKAYRERSKGKYKSVSITLEAAQMESDKKRITAAGYSLPQFWRVSVDNLPPVEDTAEPLPLPQETAPAAPEEPNAPAEPTGTPTT